MPFIKVCAQKFQNTFLMSVVIEAKLMKHKSIDIDEDGHFSVSATYVTTYTPRFTFQQ
jgi:hypothetical protein